MSKSVKQDKTLSKLIELKWRQAEQRLASLDLEIGRVEFQLNQLQAAMSNKSTEKNQQALEASLCGNAYVRKQVMDTRRLEARRSELSKHRAMAKHELRRALHAKQQLG